MLPNMFNSTLFAGGNETSFILAFQSTAIKNWRLSNMQLKTVTQRTLSANVMRF